MQSRAASAALVHHPLHTIHRSALSGLHPNTLDALIPYSPSQIRTAYGLNQLTLPNTDGHGITVAVVDPYGDLDSNSNDFMQSDLQGFSTLYNLPFSSSQLTVAFPDGKPPTVDPDFPTWAQETCLDVEWVHALAPGANILLVVSPNTDPSSIFDAIRYAGSHANIVSMSFGYGEDPSLLSNDRTSFSSPGVTYFVSSGDNGTLAPLEYPSTSPNVTAVGGTTLTIDTSGNYLSETAWSGSGGGPSLYESLPTYQEESVSGNKRQTPDISLDGDPETGVGIYFQGTFSPDIINAGTSLSAPMWAGIMARSSTPTGAHR